MCPGKVCLRKGPDSLNDPGIESASPRPPGPFASPPSSPGSGPDQSFPGREDPVVLPVDSQAEGQGSENGGEETHPEQGFQKDPFLLPVKLAEQRFERTDFREGAGQPALA